jgi:hypothetical protein
VQNPRSSIEDESPHALSSSTQIGCDPSSPHEVFADTVKVHIRVFRIMNFKDTAGWMDKTDPFVQLQLGKTIHKTAAKNNAGGAAIFDEVFSFVKEPSHNQLQVAVYDSDTVSNDLLGQTSIDLKRQPSRESIEELGDLKEGQSYDVFDAKTSTVVQGQVFLAFAVSLPQDAEAKFRRDVEKASKNHAKNTVLTAAPRDINAESGDRPISCSSRPSVSDMVSHYDD